MISFVGTLIDFFSFSFSFSSFFTPQGLLRGDESQESDDDSDSRVMPDQSGNIDIPIQ